MNVLIIYAHHDPASATAAMKNTAASVFTELGHSVKESDLYGKGFQAAMQKWDFNTISTKNYDYHHEQQNAVGNDWSFAVDIVEQMQLLKEADLVVFSFPLFWSSPPAILKGWFERVLSKGFAWSDYSHYETGMLRKKQALLLVETNEPKEAYAAEGLQKISLTDTLWPVLHNTLGYCGMDVYEPFAIYSASEMGDSVRSAELQKLTEYINSLWTNPRWYSRFS